VLLYAPGNLLPQNEPAFVHSFSSAYFTKQYSGNHTNNEIGRACGTYGDGERCIEVLGEKPEVKEHLEDMGVAGRIILKLLFKK